MQKADGDLLGVLKGELEFLENGGYIRAREVSWKPVLIFEDSPICMNHDYQDSRDSCSDCPLMQLVPTEFRSAKFPCRYIPLNAARETLDSLYRYADDHETEETVRRWLQATIAELQERRSDPNGHSEHHAPCGEVRMGTPLVQKAKCANPVCPVLFDWRKGGKLGGKFFRFREPPKPPTQNAVDETPSGVHGVRHFWLCECCSHIFTLVYKENCGVVLTALVGLADAGTEKALAADCA